MSTEVAIITKMYFDRSELLVGENIGRYENECSIVVSGENTYY